MKQFRKLSVRIRDESRNEWADGPRATLSKVSGRPLMAADAPSEISSGDSALNGNVPSFGSTLSAREHYRQLPMWKEEGRLALIIACYNKLICSINMPWIAPGEISQERNSTYFLFHSHEGKKDFGSPIRSPWKFFGSELDRTTIFAVPSRTARIPFTISLSNEADQRTHSNGG